MRRVYVDSWTSEYTIGDRVCVSHKFGEWCEGTVVGVDRSLAVCHDIYDSMFHDCNGLCEDGYGYWYFDPGLVRRADTTPFVNLNLEEGLL